jgi:hypothetical protein
MLNLGRAPSQARPEQLAKKFCPDSKNRFSLEEEQMIDAVSLALNTVNRWEIPLRTVSLCTGISMSEL